MMSAIWNWRKFSSLQFETFDFTVPKMTTHPTLGQLRAILTAL